MTRRGCRPERNDLLVAEIVAFMSDISGGGGTQTLPRRGKPDGESFTLTFSCCWGADGEAAEFSLTLGVNSAEAVFLIYGESQ